jgi:hypothetical protein
MLAMIYPKTSNRDRRKMGHFSISSGLVAVVLSIVVVGCSPPKSAPKSPLSIQVDPSNNAGEYTITGSANLPENTQITVMAIRSLDVADPQFAKSYSYTSILDRRFAEVRQGQWQTQLNLWQVDPDGHFQETWQLDRDQWTFDPTPAAEVTFVALIEPDNQIPTLRQTFQAQGPPSTQNVVWLPTERTWYVQATQRLPVTLPTGKTKPPQLKAEDINWGWGERAATKPPKSTNAKPRPTQPLEPDKTPLTPSQLMR